MKNTLRLAFAYLRYYKKQTAALFVGIMLSAALLTGVGSLFASGQSAARENARTEYGDWHYEMRCDFPWLETFLEDAQAAEKEGNTLGGEGFKIEAYGVETVRKAIDEPFDIQYVSADAGYLNMMQRELLEGKMPEERDEMAMDAQTLRNLGIAAEPGTTFELDSETFTLCGILSEMPEKLPEEMGDFMQVFVSEDLDYGMNGSFLYVKFDESRPVYDQLRAFTETYGIDRSTVAGNTGLSSYVGGDAETITLPEIGEAMQNPAMGLPYVWGVLNTNEVLTESAVLIALGIFSVFIVYSIFQVSVLKRLSQYSIMQTLGMADAGTFGALLMELVMIFAAGFTAGCALGNGAAALIYGRAGRIFITRNVTAHSGVSTEETAAEMSVSLLPDAGAFQVDWQIIASGALFLLLFLAVISFVLVRKMRSLTLREMIAKDTAKGRKNRKIYSLKKENLTGILTKRFMFSRKGTFVGILLSLSVGSVIFLAAAYATENTRINNRLTFAADDGLGSDIQVYEESDSLSDTIPEDALRQIELIESLESVLPVRYMMGEIPLNDGIFQWPAYFAETAGEEGFEQRPEIMEKYNGHIVQTGEDDYLLKVNIYGYDDEMLESLNDYVLEGEIDSDRMRAENTVIFRTLMDGQGNYDGIDIRTGDAVEIRTPADPQADGEVLKFSGPAEEYSNTSMAVNAVVSRPLGKVDQFLGNSATDGVDLIMTNEQMEENFGVTGYRAISISLAEDADASAAADAVRAATDGISRCVVRDYTGQIEAQNLYLNQQIMFFYGIAAVLLGISLLHIVNSMQYLVAERKYEFSVLRAMGITDAGFLKMLMREGFRYGVYSSIVMLVLYWFAQKAVYYFMTKVYLYLHPRDMISPVYLLVMAALNLALCTGAMVAAGRKSMSSEM